MFHYIIIFLKLKPILQDDTYWIYLNILLIFYLLLVTVYEFSDIGVQQWNPDFVFVRFVFQSFALYWRNKIWKWYVYTSLKIPPYKWGSRSIPYAPRPDVVATKMLRSLNHNLNVLSNDISTIDIQRMKEVDDLFKVIRILLHDSVLK